MIESCEQIGMLVSSKAGSMEGGRPAGRSEMNTEPITIPAVVDTGKLYNKSSESQTDHSSDETNVIFVFQSVKTNFSLDIVTQFHENLFGICLEVVCSI